MWPTLMIIVSPHAKNVVQLPETEADEVIQCLLLGLADVSFTECVCLGRLRWNTNASHVRLPEVIEFVRVLSIPIMDEGTWA